MLKCSSFPSELPFGLGLGKVEMELKKWEIFQYLDPTFTADIKHVYLVGITSIEGDDSDDEEEDSNEVGECLFSSLATKSRTLRNKP